MTISSLPELTAIEMTKTLFLVLAVLVASIVHLDAFFPAELGRRKRSRPLFAANEISGGQNVEGALTHGDIVWKVRPPPEASRPRRLWLRFAANAIRLDAMLKRQEVPLVLCPKGGQAVLEAHYKPVGSKRYEKIARFGFTTERGPAVPPIGETVHELYGLNKELMVGVGAIIYMFAEEPYRKQEVGSLALDVISLIHAIQGCDFTVLVADDNGSGKLVKWYEKQGFCLAPKLQECFGSPNGIHGATMIAPTRHVLPDDCFIKWW